MRKLLNSSLIAFAFFLSFNLSAVNAQTVKWDSLYRLGKYEELIAKFRADFKPKKDIVFLGNSITAGTDWVKLLDLPQAKNRGISALN